MGMSGLPDMYTLGPWASGVHIRQATHAHVTTIKYYIVSQSQTTFWRAEKLLSPHTQKKKWAMQPH